MIYMDQLVMATDAPIGATSGQLCGDTIVEGTEECEPSEGECCYAAGHPSECTLKPSGTACSSDDEVCTTDECLGTATCEHTHNAVDCTAQDGWYCNGTDSCSGYFVHCRDEVQPGTDAINDAPWGVPSLLNQSSPLSSEDNQKM